MAWTIFLEGRLLCRGLEAGQASLRFREALEKFQLWGDGNGASAVLEQLGLIALDRIDPEQDEDARQKHVNEAARPFLRALEGYRAYDAWSSIPSLLDRIARMLVLAEEFTEAATIFGAAARLREETRFQRKPCEVEVYQTSLERARTNLGDRSFDSLWNAGKLMTRDEAIDAILSPRLTRLLT